MKKKTTNLSWLVIFFLCLIILSCDESIVDTSNIFTITFDPNGGTVGINSMQTDTRGRLAVLPVAAREPEKVRVMDTGTWTWIETDEIRSFEFDGWFTPGGTQVTSQTVFRNNSMIVARWKSDEVISETGPLAQRLDMFRGLGDQVPSDINISVNAHENITTQNLCWDGKPVTITLTGGPVKPVLQLSGFGALFVVEEGVTLILNNIILSGRDRNTSSLIVIESGGDAEIKDGTIITSNRNEAPHFGGGVTVNIGGTLTMTGGEISRNNTFDPIDTLGVGDRVGGGGVYVRGGEFFMTGGSIYENNATAGGGVAVMRGGFFHMTGGDIYENQSYGAGGGVRLFRTRVEEGETILSRFEMYGGSIHENGGVGGGVTVNLGGQFNMFGGEVSKNQSSSGGGVFNANGGLFYMHDGLISHNSAWYDSGGVMNTGTFSMYNGTITGNTSAFGAAVGNFGNGTFFMHNGKITGNTATGSGGAVGNEGNFFMYGGEISSNTTRQSHGGAVYTGHTGSDERGVFVITGGIIYGTGEGDLSNTASTNIGGALYIANPQTSVDTFTGSLVAFGRLGHYTLINNNVLEFVPFNEAAAPDPTEDLNRFLDFMRVKEASITTGTPSVIFIDDEYQIVIDVDTAKLRTTNNTIEVINGVLNPGGMD